MAELSPKIKELNEKIDELVGLSEKEYEAWKPVYDRGWDYILNNQLAGKIIKDGWDKIQVNHIFAAVMQELAIISQRRPKLVGEPAEETDAQGTELWMGVARYMFDKTLKMPNVLMQCALDGKANGHYAVKLYWEPKACWNDRVKKWEGEVRCTVLKAENLIIDPWAECVEDSEYVGVHTRMSVEYAKSRWPDFAKEIEEEATKETLDEGKDPATSLYVTRPDSLVGQDTTAIKSERDPGTDVTLDSLIRTLVSGPTSGVTEAYKQLKKAPIVTVTELWMRDKSEKTVTETVPAEIEEMLADGRVLEAPPQPEGLPVASYIIAATGEPLVEGVNWPTNTIEYSKPVYPYGRYLLRVGTTTILNPKEEDQVWYTEHWPIITGVNYLLPHTWHGLNAVEIPSGLQDWLNVGYMHLVNSVKYCGDPVTVVEEGAVANATTPESIAKKLRSKAGSVWLMLKGRANAIRREPPPNIGNGIPMLIDGVTTELKNLTGSQDILRGQATGGRKTAFEVSQLGQSAASRPQLQSNLLDEFTLRVMDYAIELAMSSMAVGDIVRVVGENKRKNVLALEASDFDADFDMKLDVGTAMPFNQEQKRAEAMQLYQVVGPAFLPRLLDAYEVPNPEEVMQKVMEMQQQAAMQAQAEAQPPVNI